jgi:hypothetical protein
MLLFFSFLSAVSDFDLSHTRGPKERPAPIPRVVEYALRYLVGDFDRPDWGRPSF